MNLTIAVTKNSAVWNLLLEQAGVSYSLIEWKENLLEKYAVIIVNSVLGNHEKQKILRYVNGGGSLLSEADYVEKIFNIPCRKRYLKYLFSSEKIFGYYLPIIDLYRNCYVPSKANILTDQNGRYTVAEIKIGKGKLLVIPGNMLTGIYESKVRRKKFYSPVKNSPTERVSEISKGSIFHLVRISLQHLFHIRDIPFIFLWHFPGDSKNIFAFRIDTDYGSPEQVDYLYKTLQKNKIKGTWFIETKSAENMIRKYSAFQDQEIALHCYRHRIFNSYKKNYENFKKGIQILNKDSIHLKGVAAPFGEWNRYYYEAVKDLGFEYSSEFSLSYDNLPHSSVDDNSGDILQIPIHPVSFGRLYRSGFNDEDMFNYFKAVIYNKIALCEPLIFYTHPQEERYELHKRIFNFINEINLSKSTFHEYADWWKRRIKIKYSASWKNGEFKIETETNDESFRFSVITPSKENFLILLSGNKRNKMEIPGFEYAHNFDPEALRKSTKQMLKDDILFEVRKRRL